MEFRDTANMLDKTRVDSGAQKHSNGEETYHREFFEGIPGMRVMKRMSPTTRSPLALLLLRL